MAQMLKTPPAMQETQILSLDQEDPLEEGMATHSSILAWKNPMDRGAWWVTVPGVTKSQIWLSDWHTHINNAAVNILHVNFVLALFSTVEFLDMEFLGQSVCVT